MNKKAIQFLDRQFKLSRFPYDNATLRYQMPILKKTTYQPTSLIGLNEIYKSRKYESTVHIFSHDYQLEKMWRLKTIQIEKLKKFTAVCTPDYSVLMDMPMPIIAYNIYRSRMVGRILKDEGMIIIPTVSWAGRNTYDICFDGISEGSTVAISTIGTRRTANLKSDFLAGFKEMILRLSPSTILIYGQIPQFDFKTPPIIHFECQSFKYSKQKKYEKEVR